jgi:hypothetical protein
MNSIKVENAFLHKFLNDQKLLTLLLLIFFETALKQGINGEYSSADGSDKFADSILKESIPLEFDHVYKS